MTNLTGPFEGDWTYRSYSNNPDPKVDPNTDPSLVSGTAPFRGEAKAAATPTFSQDAGL
jgi:hypothetical protein